MFGKILLTLQLILVILQIIFTFSQIKLIKKPNYRARNTVVTIFAIR